MKRKIFISTAALATLFAIIWLSGCKSLQLENRTQANIRIDSALTLVPDPKLEKSIAPYREKLSADMLEVLCQSAEPLAAGRPESPLTNYCSDLVLTESNIYLQQKQPGKKMDVAVVNRGGLRTSLPQGNITIKTMYELMPFENEIVFLNLKGTILQLFADHLASRGGEGIAGMSFGIKEGKAVNLLIDGKPLQPDQNYWLATSDYVANGGDGSEILVKADQRIDTGIRVRDMFTDHFRKMGKAGKIVEAKNDRRIYHVE